MFRFEIHIVRFSTALSGFRLVVRPARGDRKADTAGLGNLNNFTKINRRRTIVFCTCPSTIRLAVFFRFPYQYDLRNIS